jgi:hypothetical protein
MISFGRNSLTQQKRYKKPIQCRGIVLDTCFPASGNKKIAMTKNCRHAAGYCGFTLQASTACRM